MRLLLSVLILTAMTPFTSTYGAAFNMTCPSTFSTAGANGYMPKPEVSTTLGEWKLAPPSFDTASAATLEGAGTSPIFICNFKVIGVLNVYYTPNTAYVSEVTGRDVKLIDANSAPLQTLTCPQSFVLPQPSLYPLAKPSGSVTATFKSAMKQYGKAYCQYDLSWTPATGASRPAQSAKLPMGYTPINPVGGCQLKAPNSFYCW